jgi:hypothetical protein
MMTINEELSTYDLSNEELQEGIDGLNNVLDNLEDYRNRIKDVNYTISKYEADEVADKLFDICDVPYLSDYIDNISTILSNLGRNDTNTRYMLNIVDKIISVVVSVLRELEEEQRYRF